MGVNFKSNAKAFNQFLKRKTPKALDDMGKTGVKNIKKETPVRSGHLKDSNSYDVDDSLYLINDADYAAFVEMGTYKQEANPFMRRGIAVSRDEFIDDIIRNLKV